MLYLSEESQPELDALSLFSELQGLPGAAGGAWLFRGVFRSP